MWTQTHHSHRNEEEEQIKLKSDTAAVTQVWRLRDSVWTWIRSEVLVMWLFVILGGGLIVWSSCSLIGSEPATHAGASALFQTGSGAVSSRKWLLGAAEDNLHLDQILEHLLSAMRKRRFSHTWHFLFMCVALLWRRSAKCWCSAAQRKETGSGTGSQVKICELSL